MSAARQPLIGISLGDPAGIGPEIVLKALAARPHLRTCVYGDPGVLDATAAALGLPPVSRDPARAIAPHAGGNGQDPAIVPGRPNLASASAQLASLQAATDDALAGKI